MWRQHSSFPPPPLHPLNAPVMITRVRPHDKHMKRKNPVHVRTETPPSTLRCVAAPQQLKPWTATDALPLTLSFLKSQIDPHKTLLGYFFSSLSANGFRERSASPCLLPSRITVSYQMISTFFCSEKQDEIFRGPLPKRVMLEPLVLPPDPATALTKAENRNRNTLHSFRVLTFKASVLRFV